MNCSIVFAFLFSLVSAQAQLQYINRIGNAVSSHHTFRSVPSIDQQVYSQLMERANSNEEAFKIMKAYAGQKTAGKRRNRFARSHYLKRM
ncbi:unnamed protein product [Oikopleura dioica]|uniref:Uncharacterized protein n=1 Tax=Oikopleura dioica TaxID=34765 RepID=E4YDG6_OIKDI|nr:unnamed protein product [Oikopleura dioica]